MATASFRRRFFNAETAIIVWLYRRFGHFFGQKYGILLLTVTGRKSHRQRIVALRYMLDGDTYVLTAANLGADVHPAWFLNLRRTPRATIQVGDKTIAVVAEQAPPEARRRLWAKWIAEAPAHAALQLQTSREFPIVMLHPIRVEHGS